MTSEGTPTPCRRGDRYAFPIVDSDEVHALWKWAEAAMPADWNVDSLRCASTGLAPVMRSERWIAVACGPAAECIAADADDAEGAFVALVERVDARTTSSW